MSVSFAGDVPECICFPSDCCIDDEASCSDIDQLYTLNLKSIDDSNTVATIDNNSIKKLVYDDDSFVFTDITATTVAATFSDEDSAGNASLDSFECFQGEDETPQFNYRGPKVLPTRHETPVSICTANTIGTLRSRRIFRVLFDSGSNVSLIKRSCLPRNCKTKSLTSRRQVATLAGKLLSKEVVIVTLRDIRLPEFDKNRQIDEHKCLVFDNDNCNYDIILGTQFLSKTGIKLC